MNKSWGEILAVLDSLLQTIKEAHVPKPLVQVSRPAWGHRVYKESKHTVVSA